MYRCDNTGHKTKTVLCPFFVPVKYTETTNDNATQDAEMTRKQHKRSNTSKQHKSRENSREMLYNVSYKSDTMTTNVNGGRCP